MGFFLSSKKKDILHPQNVQMKELYDFQLNYFDVFVM